MSPASNYGFFVSARFPYQAIEIHDHAVDASTNLSKFGLSKEFLGDLSPTRDRIEVLTKILSQGRWIRVRHRGASGEATVEHMADWISVFEAIAEASGEMSLGDLTYLVFRHIGTREEVGVQVRQLRDFLDTNRLEELTAKIR